MTNLFVKYGGMFKDDHDFACVYASTLISNLQLFPEPSSIDNIDEGISVEWYVNPRCLLSVDIHIYECLVYFAGMYGDVEVKGWHQFDGELSLSLVELIQKIQSYE